MHLESAVKSMETFKAAVVNLEEKRSIMIEIGTDNVRIPLCEDNPNDVKKAFNSLISRLKDGKFRIELTDVGEDLFSQVGAEYIKNLNSELIEVYGDMEEYGLIAVRTK